jgi:hypothetical protein
VWRKTNNLIVNGRLEAVYNGKRNQKTGRANGYTGNGHNFNKGEKARFSLSSFKVGKRNVPGEFHPQVPVFIDFYF